MKIKLYFFSIFVYSLCVGCQSGYSDSSYNLSKITIDLDKIETQSFLDLFSQIELIPLQTIDSCLLGITYPSFTDTCYFMRDHTQQQLLSFNDRGELNFKISNHGEGPGQYRDLSNICYNSFSRKLFLIERPCYIYEYNLNGQFIQKKCIDSLSSGIENIAPIGRDSMVIITGNEFSDYYFYSYQRNTILKHLKDSTFHFGLNKFYRNGNRVYHFKWFDNTVYEVKGQDFVPSYFLDFGKYNHSVKDYTNVFQNLYSQRFDDEKLGTLLANNFSFRIDNIQENSKYLLIILTKLNGNVDRMEVLNIIYNKKTKKASFIDTKGVVWNQWGDQLTEDGYYITHMNAVDKEYLDSTLLDAKSRKLYDQVGENDNPVLIKYRFR